MTTFLIFVFVYMLTNWAGYVIHWSFHQKWSGPFYKAHYNHHNIQYPPNDFFSEKYRSAGKDSSAKFFILAFLPLIAGWFAIMFLMHASLFITIGILIELILIGVAHDRFHDTFHIQNHWLNRFSFFRKWTKIHQIHHIDTSKNYGIYDFMWDKIYGSFQK